MADTKLTGLLLTGNHAGRPAANTVAGGTLYACSTHSLVYQSDGSSWSTWATLGTTETLPATIIDAKGDLIAGTAADTAARVAVGSNDQILMADSGQSSGLKWVSSQTPTTQAFSDAAAEGTADTFARGDHKHGMPADPGGGGGSDPIADAFGTPDTAFEFNANSFTGLTAMGTADVESMHGTVAGHLLLADDDAEQVGRYASVSPACTLIVKLTDFVAYENYQYVGAFVGEATPGKIEAISLLGGASPSLVLKQWNPYSSGSPTNVSITRMPTDPVGYTPWYFGIKVVSSTDISYYASRSGVVWQPLLLSRNPSFTVGSFGISVGNYAGGGQPRAAGCYDFMRIWNSAKTFPAFS